MISKKNLQTMLSVLGAAFFIMTASVYFFFRSYDFSAMLAVALFVLSLSFSWAAVAMLKYAEEGGITEMLSWGFALLDSVLSIVLILLFLSGSSLFEWGL